MESYATHRELVKPSITETIGKYISLRKAGKEYTGLCPFHADKHPSLSVNEDKGLFHCFACGESGDVIDFVERIDGVSFKEALAELGMDTTGPSRRHRRVGFADAQTMKARKVACWANEMTYRAQAMLREIGQGIYICSIARQKPYTDQKLIRQHEAGLIRQWAIIEDIAEDLQNENCVAELYRRRAAIEDILADAIIEPWPEFPALTPEYRKSLSDLMDRLGIEEAHNG